MGIHGGIPGSSVPRFAVPSDHRCDVESSIARLLHDGAAQELFLARLSLAELAESLPARSDERSAVDASLARVTSALHEVRRTIDRLRGEHADVESDLAVALRRELMEFGARTGVAVSFVDGSSAGLVLAEATPHVVAIVREAMTNAVKHGCAGEVRVRVRRRGRWVRVTVCDDGDGFGVAEAAERDVGFGLGMSDIQERARLLGATLAVRSDPEIGTTLTLDVPIGRRRSDAR